MNRLNVSIVANFNSGNLLKKLRIEAGYTQKSLAEVLYVSDKAVSKWERGVCMPDSSLLPKLSVLLDTDIEYLISNSDKIRLNNWCCAIFANDIDDIIAGRPKLFYLLSYGMLVGITDFFIKTTKKEFVKSLNLKQYGINIFFDRPFKFNYIVIYESFLLFGNNLTRYLQSFMNCGTNLIPTLNNIDIPMLFVCSQDFKNDLHKNCFDRKPIGRGMVFLPLNKESEIFIKCYEKHTLFKIADLMEIANNRGLL